MRRHPSSPAALAVWSGMMLGMLAPTSRAQLSAWLDFDGTIKGESTDAQHKDWIEIRAFNAGASRQFGDPDGGTRDGGKPMLSEFSLVKPLDQASPPLFVAAVAGTTPFPKVTLDLNVGGKNPVSRIELEDVLVSSFSSTAAANGDAKPTETFSLNFAKITFTYILPDAKTLFTSYDIVKNTSSSGGGGGTPPPNPDADNDGMPDSWEAFYGLNTGGNDAQGDADGDGLSNLQEYQLGTHPKSGTSFFKATLAPSATTPGTCQLTWNSVAGKTYVIEWSPDLATPFTAVRTVTATSTQSAESFATSGNSGFYRVRPQ